jgi:Fe-S-cluster containining protein
MQNKKLCIQCGNCCRYEIPVTILDIYRISEFLKQSPEITFNQILSDDINHQINLFRLKKDKTGTCIFQKENKCTIQHGKPLACEFYFCNLNNNNKDVPWISFSSETEQEKIWEQSIATMITRHYISLNGNRWNGEDYEKAINAIHKNIRQSKTQKIKLSKDTNKAPMCMIYDCTVCSDRGEIAKETPISIIDILKISDYLGLSLDQFFEQYIEKELSSGGLLNLKDILNVYFLKAVQVVLLKMLNHIIVSSHLVQKKAAGLVTLTGSSLDPELFMNNFLIT